jgi:hypothetical protein
MNARTARISLVSFFSVLSLALAGCSADAPEPITAPPGNGSPVPANGGTQAPPEGGETAQQPAAAPAEEGEKEGAPADPAQPADPSGKQPTQADPACVSSCNSGLKTKCQGDDTFCEDMCIVLTAQELSCLTSASTCDKTEWNRCVPQESGGSK